MRLPKLSRLEHQIMQALWSRGASSVREILEAFPEKGRPAYTTVQTMVYRLEEKGAIRRTKKIGNAVVRNRVKRRLSEIVRAELDAIEPADIVIRALPAAGEADLATLRAGIAPLLVRGS